MNKTELRILTAALIGLLTYGGTFIERDQRLAIGIMTGVPSFVLMLISKKQLGDAFSLMPEAKTLVTSGVYSKIQHPLYVFLDLFLASIIVILGLPVLLAAWGILVVMQSLQSRLEERVLANAFGPEYEKYKAHTWL